jgi:hypothetical protein
MEPQNIDEYKGLRHEIAALKSCITTYIGFVFLVVSTAFWQLAKEIPLRPSRTMAVVALMLGLGLKLVLFLLLYKFVSHNRYCGYCKLLEQEMFEGKGRGNGKCPEAVFIWEVCLDRLRSSDFRPDGLALEIKYYGGGPPQTATLETKARQFSGPAPTADQGRSRKGWRLLLRSGSEERGTWQFPLYVARIFAAIDVGLFGLGVALLLPRHAAGIWGGWREAPLHLLPSLLFWLLLFVLLLCWRKLMADLYRQMKGSQTVDAFCWKFVAIRYRILHDLGLATTGYKLVACPP